MKQKICFTFVWRVHDISPLLSSDELNTIRKNLEAGLKELPSTEQFTFALGEGCPDTERQQLASLEDL